MSLKITTTNSVLKDRIIEIYEHDIGVLYFFENFVISEINEGIHVNTSTAKHLIEAINLFYDNDKSYGYISNRVNDFSVSPLDFSNFQSFLKNMNSYAVVAANDLKIRNTNLEKRFCKLPYKDFNCIVDAFKWAESQLKIKQNIIYSI